MSLALNTQHALYLNIVSLIAVDGGALVDLTNSSRHFTPASGTSYGAAAAGNLGEFFRSVNTGSYTAQGASFTPAITESLLSGAYTIFVVISGYSGGIVGPMLGDSSGNNYFLNLGIQGTNFGVGRGPNLTVGSKTITNAIHSFAVTKPATDNQHAQGYVDGVADISDGTPYTSDSARFDYIGGYPGGQGSLGADFVYVVVFNKVLSQTEIQGLHSSLGANHTFALVTTSGSAAGTASGATLTGPGSIAAGTASGTTAQGTLTTAPHYRNNTALRANESGVTLNIYNASTGALVLQATGLTTDSNGKATVSNAAIVTGATYAYETIFTSDSTRRLPTGTAS